VPKEKPLPDSLTVARKVAAGDAKGFFTREGDTFRAGNGRLVLTGRLGNGNMVRSVTLDGEEKPYGQYNAMLQTRDAEGRNRWTNGNTVKAVEGRVTDGIAVIELTSTTTAGLEGFEITHRLTLPPGTPWFISEIVSVKNTGTLPLHLKGLYFRLYNEFKSIPEKLPPNLWGMPPSGYWLDETTGRFFGAVASRTSDIRIFFWFDKPGEGQHPDACLELDKTDLAPNEAFVPAAPVYLFCVAGRGSNDTWMTTIQDLMRVLE